MHVPSYGGIIWLKHEEMETNFPLGIKGLKPELYPWALTF